jgi:hypothetical protein
MSAGTSVSSEGSAENLLPNIGEWLSAGRGASSQGPCHQAASWHGSGLPPGRAIQETGRKKTKVKVMVFHNLESDIYTVV